MLIKKSLLFLSNSHLKYVRFINLKASAATNGSEISLNGKTFVKDEFTNITPKIISHLERNLHRTPSHPLYLVHRRIVDYFYSTFLNTRGNPVFSIHDNLPPIVSISQNFDSLLIPKDHPSRSKSDCYYVNGEYLLRAHMTAHQSELLRSGLDCFLMSGDVYRRDEIDHTHYPVFHQVDAVRLKTRDQLFGDNSLQIFEISNSTNNYCGEDVNKQDCHTLEAVKLMEHELKTTLAGLARNLFGERVEFRWVETFFPFTHPSWELEVFYNGTWLELLGCGIMRQPILANAGITDQIGWAFGLGLERVAMCLYKIPDIRLFWSQDSGFLSQFKTDNINANITYKPVSQYPQCSNDISFWLPTDRDYNSNDFYDLVRSVGGDLIEQVTLVDKFSHPKTKQISHCYKIVYRHMERTLTQSEVNVVHKEIEKIAAENLSVTIR